MLARKIAYNSIISIVARAISTVVALVIIGIITRHLGETGFGEYSIIISFLYIFTVLADLGLYQITIREISKEGADEAKIASSAFILRSLSGFFFFALASLVVLFFPYSRLVKIGIALAAPGFWSISSYQVLISIFQKYLRMDKVALAEIVGKVLQLCLVLVFIKQNYGFFSIVLAFTFGSLLNYVLILWFLRSYIRLKIELDFKYIKRILKESYPLAISAILIMIYFKLDAVMLSIMPQRAGFGLSVHDPPYNVGIYSLAYRVLESLIFLPAMFVGLIMPLLSRYAFLNQAAFKKIIQKTNDVLIIFIVPIIAGIVFLSSKIIWLMSGDGFSDSATILNILSFATGVIFFGTLFGNTLIALGKQNSLAYIYGIGAVFNFGMNLFVIPRYSYYGAAISTFLTEFLVTILMMVIMWRAIKYLPSFRLFYKSFFASIAMTPLFYFFESWNLFLLIFFGGLIYFIIFYLLGGIKFDELAVFLKKEN